MKYRVAFQKWVIITICFLVPMLSACNLDSGGTADNLSDRQSEFVSANPNGYSTNAPLYGGLENTDQATEGVRDDQTEEIAREIEEADIVKIEDNVLYILNQYRGIMLCDISAPDAPSIKGQLAITGKPVQMYVRDKKAYIITSNYTPPLYETVNTAVASIPTTNSSVIIIDIADIANPTYSGKLDIQGEVTDTRLVGNVLYVVSSIVNDYYSGSQDQSASGNSTTYIAAINIENPDDIKKIDQIDLQGSAAYIHVTENAIFIASRYGYYRDDKTTISYIDISDPDGKMSTRGNIDINGSVQDKFKMDYANGMFRVCTYIWQDSGLSKLTIIDVSNPDQLTEVSNIDLGKGEQLFATRFDNDRVYLVTYERVDPLWIVDLENPQNPEIKGELEVPGWSTYIEPKGDRLITLGVDDNNGRQVSLSLFNVQDPAAPSLIKRISFGNSDGWSSTSAYDDVKALTILDEMGLILLPYSYSGYQNDRYVTENRLQLVDFSPDDINQRGWITQKGSVLRSKSVNDRLFSISPDQVQVIDATDRDNPKVTASATIAYNLIDFIAMDNSYGMQVVLDNGTYSLRMVDLQNPDTDQVISEVPLNGYGYQGMITNQKMVYVATSISGYRTEPVSGAVLDMPYYGYDQTRIQVFDFSQPQSPQLRGYIDMPGTYVVSGKNRQGTPMAPYNYQGEILKLNDSALVFIPGKYYYAIDYALGDSIGSGSTTEVTDPDNNNTDIQSPDIKPDQNSQDIMILSLSNPDLPQIISKFSTSTQTSSQFFINNQILYFSYTQDYQNDTSGRPQVKYYLGRYDLSDQANPSELKAINIPGICLHMSDDGTYAYTLDTKWSGDNELKYAFSSVQISEDTAYLLDEIAIESYYYDIIFTQDYAFLKNYGYYYTYTRASNLNDLTVLDIRDPEHITSYDSQIEALNGSLLGAKNNKLFLNLYQGVACYDTSDVQNIKLNEYKSQAGYSQSIYFTTDSAYISLGYSGLWVKRL